MLLGAKLAFGRWSERKLGIMNVRDAMARRKAPLESRQILSRVRYKTYPAR